jgi:hypothetical protein
MWGVIEPFQDLQVLRKNIVHIYLKPILWTNNSSGGWYQMLKKNAFNFSLKHIATFYYFWLHKTFSLIKKISYKPSMIFPTHLMHLNVIHNLQVDKSSCENPKQKQDITSYNMPKSCKTTKHFCIRMWLFKPFKQHWEQSLYFLLPMNYVTTNKQDNIGSYSIVHAIDFNAHLVSYLNIIKWNQLKQWKQPPPPTYQIQRV